MRSFLKLDQDHNDAIRAEVGDRLRIILRSADQLKSPSRIQHLLDRLSKLDDETERTNSPSIAPSMVATIIKAFRGSLRRRAH
jgi:hypothetical protein